MSRKGLSLDEKKVKMLEIFHETKDFYQLKELEKIAPKSKGIVQQSVKDVVVDLYNEGLVQFDKIGTSNYYWSFPSQADAVKHAHLDKITREAEVLRAKVREAERAAREASAGREEDDTRRALLSRLAAAQQTTAALSAELAAFGVADPAKLEEKRAGVRIAREAAARWTENTMLLLGMAKTMGAEEHEIRNMLEIGPDWEDLVA